MASEEALSLSQGDQEGTTESSFRRLRNPSPSSISCRAGNQSPGRRGQPKGCQGRPLEKPYHRKDLVHARYAASSCFFGPAIVCCRIEVKATRIHSLASERWRSDPCRSFIDNRRNSQGPIQQITYEGGIVARGGTTNKAQTQDQEVPYVGLGSPSSPRRI